MSVIDEVRKELLRQTYIKDYRNNKYNFRKENIKAQNHVKRKLKLIADNVTFQNFFQTYSETASRYLKQLENDHRFDFINLLKCERLNNISFKITFGNIDGEPTKTYKVTYVGKGSYNYGITISELPLEKIEVPQNTIITLSNDEDYELNELEYLGNREDVHYYKVISGETLQSIARKCNTTVETLCKLNHVGKNVRLRAGQILKYKYDNDTDFVTKEQSTPEAIDTTFADKTNEIDNVDVDETKVYDVVEEMPQFPGGSYAFWKYLSKSIQYPVSAEENGVQGRVNCSFVVEPNGAISNVKVIKSVDPSLDKEAVRVLSSMPNWIPGKSKGKNVRVKYMVPVTFRLQ